MFAKDGKVRAKRGKLILENFIQARVSIVIAGSFVEKMTMGQILHEEGIHHLAGLAH